MTESKRRLSEPWPDIDYDATLNIVLVEPEIPGNTGTIGRMCVGLDITLTLIEPLGYTLDDKQLRRAGLDYWPHLKWQTLPSLDAFWDICSDPQRLHFYTTKTDRPYAAAQHRHGDFLIFGKETKGLPESLLARYPERCFTIPMYGQIRSLNLAVATGVVAYDAVRSLSQGFTEPPWP